MPFSVPLAFSRLPHVRLYVFSWNSNNKSGKTPRKEKYRIRKMQSRVATVSGSHGQSLFRRLAALSSGGRTADPAVHSTERSEINPAEEYGESEGIEKVTIAKARPAKEEPKAEGKQIQGTGMDPLAPPNPPHAPNPRLESTPVDIPIEPIIQQKRKNRTKAPVLEEVSCEGLNGTPSPFLKDADGKYETEDDKEYLRHHKPSPLSEIRLVDSRKPITRATDGTADAEDDRLLRQWLPEQLDTAEEALERARRIWRENVMRGDPDSPHGRVLRVLRGEWF